VNISQQQLAGITGRRRWLDAALTNVSRAIIKESITEYSATGYVHQLCALPGPIRVDQGAPDDHETVSLTIRRGCCPSYRSRDHTSGDFIASSMLACCSGVIEGAFAPSHLARTSRKAGRAGWRAPVRMLQEGISKQFATPVHRCIASFPNLLLCGLMVYNSAQLCVLLPACDFKRGLSVGSSFFVSAAVRECSRPFVISSTINGR
jgi:hypothetical protein